MNGYALVLTMVLGGICTIFGLAMGDPGAGQQMTGYGLILTIMFGGICMILGFALGENSERLRQSWDLCRWSWRRGPINGGTRGRYRDDW